MAAAERSAVESPGPGSRFLFHGAEGGPTLVLAHGAGAPMDSPFMVAAAAGLGERGLRVARFEFDYMRARREGGGRPAPDREPQLRRAWLDVIAALGGGPRLWIGGKSLGGRIASMVADEAGVRGLVCLGYPFRPPGAPPAVAARRTAHLRDLRTPALIVQGTRDSFGGRDEVGGYALSPSIRVHWIEDGDHSLTPRKSSGRTAAQALAETVAAVAEFVLGGRPAQEAAVGRALVS